LHRTTVSIRTEAVSGRSPGTPREYPFVPVLLLFAVVISCALFAMAVRAGLPHGLRTFDPVEAPVLDPVEAPVLDLDDLAGRRHVLADYRGEVLVINFWTTWCTPCRQELPGMARAARELAGDGIRVITVAMGQDAMEVGEFIEQFAFDLPKLVDPDGLAAERWQVRTLPTSFVVDPAGRVVLQVIGAYDWEAPGLWDQLRDLAMEPLTESRSTWSGIDQRFSKGNP